MSQHNLRGHGHIHADTELDKDIADYIGEYRSREFIHRQPASYQITKCIRDTELRNKLINTLSDYMYIDEDDEPDIGSYIRYIDRRDFPPKLQSGGFVIDCEDTHIKIKFTRKYCVKISRDFSFIFQKKRRRDHLLDAAFRVIKEYE